MPQYNDVLNRAQGLFLPLLDLNNQFFVAALLLVGGYKAFLPGAPTDVGNLVGFLFMASMFFSPISTLGNQYNQALTAMAAAERVFLLLDTAARMERPADGNGTGADPRPGRVPQPVVRLRSDSGRCCTA